LKDLKNISSHSKAEKTIQPSASQVHPPSDWREKATFAEKERKIASENQEVFPQWT